jgi:hypothetical protein
MPEHPTTLGCLADEVRSKNAGPFWQTLDVFLRSDEEYQALIASRTLTPERIAELYLVPAESVEVFHMKDLRAVKISFPRRVPAGSFEDRDQHAGQQHVPLAGLAIPGTARWTSRARAPLGSVDST